MLGLGIGRVVTEVGRLRGLGLGRLIVDVCVVLFDEDLSRSGTINATLGTGEGAGLTSRDRDGGAGLGSRDLGCNGLLAPERVPGAGLDPLELECTRGLTPRAGLAVLGL